MKSSNSYPPIKPVPEGIKRPFWSVMIPTYNCADYLKQTLASVLAQAPSADVMQIEVIDDVSTQDDPQAVVREFGEKRVSFFRQPHNVGVPANFTTCIQRAVGDWVHILHGDDMVTPEFYKTIANFIEKHPDVSMVFTQGFLVNEYGEKNKIIGKLNFKNKSGPTLDLAEHLFDYNLIIAPSVVMRREVYQKLGGFAPSLRHTCDYEMWLRVALHYKVGYLAQPLILYRWHSNNDSHNYRKVKGLEESYKAQQLVLTTCSDCVSSLKTLQAKTAWRSAGQALYDGYHEYQSAHYNLTMRYVWFALRLLMPLAMQNMPFFLSASKSALQGMQAYRSNREND